ncbi:MAG: hypothetical protein MZW92_49850 [Comamonadaceae bacterium]|nr:hypothetical protein [Comamonadaceae bacterium]
MTLAWRMLLRDLRAGELRLLGIAMIIAVASLTSVSFFTDRLAQRLDARGQPASGRRSAAGGGSCRGGPSCRMRRSGAGSMPC